MGPIAAAALLQPGDAVLSEVDRLCDAAFYLRAHALLAGFAPLRQWTSTRARCVGGRLATHLGGEKTARALWLRAAKADPDSPEARSRAGGVWFELRGPLAAWRWLEGYEAPADAPAHATIGVSWLRAQILIAFRDFERAGTWLAKAESEDPHELYTRVLRVGWLVAQDRYDEGLELARALAAEFPGERTAVESLAHLIQLHGRFDESYALLSEAAPRFESGRVHLETARLALELRRPARAIASIEAAERCLPLAERDLRQAIAVMRSVAAYQQGDVDTAIAEGRKYPDPVVDLVCAHMESRPAGRRVLLDVGFVRQHHLTCMPATLTTLVRYWKRPADHLGIVDRICYDGTPAHAAREWAVSNGWITREFSVTWDVTRALLDRGVPFVLSTVQATSAHAQAVIGYDERRGTVAIRDPYLPATLEAEASGLFGEAAAHVPRGLVLVPGDRPELLFGIEFPEAGLYERAGAVELALRAHDRAGALRSAEELESAAPGHRLTHFARRVIGAYDGNSHEVLRAIEALLASHPQDPALLVSSIDALRRATSSEVVRARLESLCAEKDAHPVFREMLAGLLAEDGREIARAEALLTLAARQLRDRAPTLAALAGCASRSLDHERAFELHRFAACLEPTSTEWSEAYFHAGVARGRTAEVVRHLEERAQRHLARSAGPSLSLFSALDSLDRTSEAFEALERAIAARPRDGDLLLFAAQAHARYGRTEQASRRLLEAEGCSARTAWLRAAAEVASAAGDLDRAVELLEQAVEHEPHSASTHAALAVVLRRMRGAKHAREHLLHACARFPERTDLLGLSIQWQSGEDPAALEAALARFLALEPSNAWARRERALALSRLQRLPEARAEAELARAVAPQEPQTEMVLATIAELEGELEHARGCWRGALDRSGDASLAIAKLVELAGDGARACEVLGEVAEIVARTSVSGEGVYAWWGSARKHLSPEAVAAGLEGLGTLRPDLWWVWACTASHQRVHGTPESAVAAADELVRRFPLLPGSWVELARAHSAAGRGDREIEALERAIEIRPGASDAVCSLARARQLAGAEDQGLAVLERGLRHEPTDAQMSLARTDCLWRLGRREEALASVRSVIEVDPDLVEAWDRVRSFGSEGGIDAIALVREIVEHRPWNAELWLQLARLELDEDPEPAMRTAMRALEVDPLSIAAHDLRAVIAARLQDRELAEAACRPDAFGRSLPVELRARHAWVAAEFGDLGAAIERIKVVVRDRPDFFWGHARLADWAGARDQHGLALEAARAMVRLAPSRADSHGYLGEALANAGDEHGALLEYERALAIEPGYAWAAARAFEMLLGSWDCERARALLARIERDNERSNVRLWRIEIFSREGRHAEAFAVALEAAADAGTPDAVLERALEALAKSDQRRTIAWLEAQLEVPGARACLVTSWVRLRCAAGRVPGPFAVRRLRARDPELAGKALAAVFEQLAARHDLGRLLLHVCFQLRFVRSRDELWAQVGYALSTIDRSLLTVAWMRDHRAREPQSWALLNLAIALRNLGRTRAAESVSRRALTSPPDATAGFHRTLLALEAATCGRTEEAVHLRSGVIAANLPAYYAKLHALTGLLLALEEPGADRRAVAAAVLAQVAGLWNRGTVAPLRGRIWRRIARRAARRSGSVLVWWRGTWDTAVVRLVLGMGLVMGFSFLSGLLIRFFRALG